MTETAGPAGDFTVAIVHDYLTQRGGAERVVLAMLRAYPNASLHTSVYQPETTFPEFRHYRITTMPIDKLRLLRRHHRAAFPLLAPSFSAHRIDADVVLCSSSGWAHGVSTPGVKVVYCHTPARWLYQTRRYAGRDGGLGRVVRLAAAGALRLPLRRWDTRAASSADAYLANSRAVQHRVRELYGVDAALLPPPVSIDAGGSRSSIPGLDPGFLLCVSRLLPYKNVDAVLAAMREMPDQRLVVVGDGPESNRLRNTAPSNATFVGQVADAQMRWLYANCRAVVAASHEDFGLVPLEAAAFGKPTAALRWGGFLDTVIEGETGVFFDDPTSAAIAAAVGSLDGRLRPERLVSHARTYDLDAFGARLRSAVDDARKSRREVDRVPHASAPRVVCFSTADWDATLWTNKQHLMDRLSREGVGVLYVDSLGLRSPGLGSADARRIVRRLRGWRPFARLVQPGVWRDIPLVVPRHGSSVWRTVNNLLLRFRLSRNRAWLAITDGTVVWAYNPGAVDIVPDGWPIVYHCVDDLAAFPGVDAAAFRAAEKRAVARATVCIASSRPLVRHLQTLGARRVEYWPNPADVKSFAAVRPAVSDQARPIVGFAGAIQTHKVDLELISACARLRPGWDFELVGPVGHGLADAAADVRLTESLPANIQLRAPVLRAELPDLFARFAVGMIPYRINDYTAGVFPMKVFEYLSSGMPVVSTPLPSLVGEVEHVRFASGPEEFVAALQEAVDAGRAADATETRDRQRYALGHSWTARTREALDILKDLGVTP